jgi:phage-related protein (TIGR01555 family)
MLHEMNLDIISVKGLSNALASGQEEFIKTRFETYAHLKSLWGLMVLDADEQFNNRQFSMSGLDKIMEKFYDTVHGATHLPVSRLGGKTARGLNDNGDNDVRDYYDFIESEQEDKLLVQMTILDQIMAMNLWGEVPEDWSFEFKSLWQLSDKEQAEVDFQNAQRDTLYVDRGIVSELTVAKQLQQRGTYDNLDDDIKLLEEAPSGLGTEEDEDENADTNTNTNQPEGSAE